MQDLTHLQFLFLEKMMDMEMEMMRNPSSPTPSTSVNGIPSSTREEMRQKALARNRGGHS